MPLLEGLHGLTRTRLVQGTIVAQTIRFGKSGFDQADDEGFRDVALQQSNALDAFEIAVEKVHADAARTSCADYAKRAREISKAAAGVPVLDADEALVYIKASRGRTERRSSERSSDQRPSREAATPTLRPAG